VWAVAQGVDVGTTSWGSWSLRRADADLATVVAEATAAVPQQLRGAVAEMAGDYYLSLDAALAYDAPTLLAEHFARYRDRLPTLAPGVDRAALVRSLSEVLGRHVDAETRALVTTLVSQTVLIVGQRPPLPAEQVPEALTTCLLGRLDTAVEEGRLDDARAEVVRALEQGTAPDVLLDEVLLPLHEILLARQDERPLPRTESERLQETMRTLLFSLVPPDLSFPLVSRRVLLAEPRLPTGWRAGPARTVFEAAGWHVDTVLDDACPESFAKAAVAHESQVAVVTAARAADLDRARRRIAALRSLAPEVRVLALGRPFRAVPTLAARLDADEGCGGLGDAITGATRLLRTPAS
jgi:hypothetical protein